MKYRILLIIIVFFLAGCGKKAPPFIPEQEFPLKVVELQAESRGGEIYLYGSIEGDDDSKYGKTDIAGGVLYYGLFNAEDSPCAGCPVEFHGQYDFGPEAVSENGFSMKLPEDISCEICYFKIRLLGPERIPGPASGTVRLVTE